MSLATRLSALATRIGTEVKALRTLINGNAADLSALTTTAKGNLVLAINEVKAQASAPAGAQINDATTSTTAVWSSQKTTDHVAAQITILTTGAPTALNTLDELAAALGDDANFAGTVTTALGNRLRFDAAQVLTAPQKVQGNDNLGSLSLVQSGDPEQDLVAVFNAAIV